jgi:DNA-binding NarL/FixJ family response regulator
MEPVIGDAAARPHIVLLIADDRERLAMTALLLEFTGFRVIPAASIADGRERTRLVQPHVVVADLRPSSRGDRELLRELQSPGSTWSSHLVLVVDDDQVVQPALVRLCSAILGRTMEPSSLVQAVRKAAG